MPESAGVAQAVYAVLVRGRMETGDTETGHGAGEVQVRGDAQGAGVGVLDV